MNSTLEYMVNADNIEELYIVAKVEGLMLGWCGPLTWPAARQGDIAELAADLVPGELPDGKYIKWQFKTSGPYWSDKLGWCNADDFVLLHQGQRILFSSHASGIEATNFETGDLYRVAKKKLAGYAGYK